FEALTPKLEALNTWEAEAINKVIQEVVKDAGIKFAKIALPLRVAISGDAATPSIDITVKLVGKERTLARIESAVKHIHERA
ncbi:MAG: hypothetical protein WBM41_18115, partial [Arenicellales bacterium]